MNLEDELEQYVYDIYYAPRNMDINRDELYFEAVEQEYHGADILVQDKPDWEEEEDSNDEDNWRNDYPDEYVIESGTLLSTHACGLTWTGVRSFNQSFIFRKEPPPLSHSVTNLGGISYLVIIERKDNHLSNERQILSTLLIIGVNLTSVNLNKLFNQFTNHGQNHLSIPLETHYCNYHIGAHGLTGKAFVYYRG